MKKNAILGPVFAVALLAGCSGPAAPDTAPVTVPPAPGSNAAPDGGSAAATASASATESAASPAAEGPKKSERGNLLKEPGQVAGIMNEDGSEQTLFTVHLFKTDFKCTGQYKKVENDGRDGMGMPLIQNGRHFDRYSKKGEWP